MKLLLVNPSRRQIAGTETYLALLARQWQREGWPCALLSESDHPAERAPIVQGEVPDWCGAQHWGHVEDWKPEVVLVNGRPGPILENWLLDQFPCVYFAHNYYGTCISGFKTRQRPRITACERQLGLACLALYLPLGCGGNNPLTMFHLYGQETAHQQRLRRYRLIVTHSGHMQAEYVRHGFAAGQVHAIPFACFPDEQLRSEAEAVRREVAWHEGPVRLLFAGRLEAIKGGAELLAAAALLAGRLQRDVQLTMAGEGERLAAWQQRAAAQQARQPRFRAFFPGWMTAAALASAYREHHLFVMPSRWPEPFGKGGMEAAAYGCPSVAYALGGIPSWLEEGVNGCLASPGEPAVENLATALQRALQDPSAYLRFRFGAWRKAQQYTAKAHLQALRPLLEQARWA